MNRSIKDFLMFPLNQLYKLSPKVVIGFLFRIKCGYRLNLREPKTYCEKLNWMKFNYYHSLIPKCADKHYARKYIEKMGFGEFLPCLYWSGKNPEDIPFDDLPEKFVIKVTKGSGYNIICTSKSELDKLSTTRKIKKWLNHNHFSAYGEWFYNVIEPRIIIEEFLSNPDNPTQSPTDYKLFYFNGINGGDVGCTAVDTDRFSMHRRTIYDRNWKMLPNTDFDFPTAVNQPVEKPACYELMIDCTKKLSRPFIHLRVDFYLIGSCFYIGELTFTNGAGFDRVSPYSFDELMGSWMDINGQEITTYVPDVSIE